jgi:hypothetical protein
VDGSFRARLGATTAGAGICVSEAAVADLTVLDDVVIAHADQEVRINWRRGPDWSTPDGRTGWWAISPTWEVAIRVELGAVPLLDWLPFEQYLHDVRGGLRRWEAQLRAIDARAGICAPLVPVASTRPSLVLVDRLDGDLAELNERARRELARYPEPEGCPTPGQWVRLGRLDDDLRWGPLKPSRPWHLVRGWQSDWGTLALRCNNRDRDVNRVVVRGLRNRALRVSDSLPDQDVCRRCSSGEERDSVTGR